MIDASKWGLHVAKEMLEAYYWNRRFKASHRDILDLLRILCTDRLGLGLIPAYHVRHLQVQVEVGASAFLESSEDQSDKFRPDLRAMEALMHVLTARTELVIAINILEDAEDHSDLKKVSDALEDLLHDTIGTSSIPDGGAPRTTITRNTTWNE